MKKYTKDSALGRVRKFSNYMNVHREERRVSKRQPLLMIGGALLTGFVVKHLLKGGSSPVRGRRRDDVSDWNRRGEQDAILNRDQSGPVSVSSDKQGHPSYTYNAEKSEPYDPHMSDENPPGRSPAAKNTEGDALDRDKPGPVSVSSRDRQKEHKSHPAGQSGEENKAAVLDRDQSSPVSVSSDAQGHTSYTYNAEKSEPYDPHMMEENPPGRAAAPKNTEENALDRDKPGRLSVKGDKSLR